MFTEEGVADAALLERLECQRRVIVAQATVLEDLGFDLYDVVTAAPDEGINWRPFALLLLAFLAFSMLVHPGALLDAWSTEALRALG